MSKNPNQKVREDDGCMKPVQSSTEDLKVKVFRWLRNHPLDAKKGKRGKLLKLASDLGIDYKKHKSALQHYSSEFMTALNFGNAPTSPTFHRVVVGAYDPKCLDRNKYPEVVEQALRAGWGFTKNRNKEMVWNEDRALGRVRWFETGRVLAHIRKPQTEERKKMLLTSAFGITGLIINRAILVEFIQSYDMVAWHEVHHNPAGEPLPYMVIDSLSELLGVSAKVGDLSHRDSVEFIVIKPKWIEKSQELQLHTLETLKMNHEFIQGLFTPKKPSQDTKRLYE